MVQVLIYHFAALLNMNKSSTLHITKQFCGVRPMINVGGIRVDASQRDVTQYFIYFWTTPYLHVCSIHSLCIS